MEKIFANRACCKWVNHYERLIDRAKNRQRTGYMERHHIVPRCLGGSDSPDNLVFLTPEEHYTAHLMLIRIFPEEEALVSAVLMMCVSSPTTPRSNKIYGWVRRRFAEKQRERMLEWHSKNTHRFLGRRHTEETKRRIGEVAKKTASAEVHMYNLDGSYSRSFDSMTEAAEFVQRHVSTVWAAANNPRRTCGGYRFSYDRLDVLPLDHFTRSRKLKWKWNEDQAQKKGAKRK